MSIWIHPEIIDLDCVPLPSAEARAECEKPVALIVLGDYMGQGLRLVREDIPEDKRAKVVIISWQELGSDAKQEYAKLGVTQFCLRKNIAWMKRCLAEQLADKK